jgi:hypothetical protein
MRAEEGDGWGEEVPILASASSSASDRLSSVVVNSWVVNSNFFVWASYDMYLPYSFLLLC